MPSFEVGLLIAMALIAVVSITQSVDRPSPDCQAVVIDAPADYVPPSDGDDDGIEC